MTAPIVHSAKELRDMLLMQLQVRMMHLTRRSLNLKDPKAVAARDAKVKTLRSILTYLEAIVVHDNGGKKDD